MKGLFYKEGRCLWQYGKSYILLVVIFFGLTFLNKGGGGANPLWLLYPVFFVGSLPASLLSADERDGWLAYCDTDRSAAACSGEVCYQRCADGAHHHVGAAYQRAYRAAHCGRRHSRAAVDTDSTAAGGGAGRSGTDVSGYVQIRRHKRARGVYRCGDDRVGDLRGADGIRIGKRGADRTSDFAGHHHYTGDIRRQLGAVRKVVQGPGAVNRAEGGDYPPPSEKIAGKTGNGC